MIQFFYHLKEVSELALLLPLASLLEVYSNNSDSYEQQFISMQSLFK